MMMRGMMNADREWRKEKSGERGRTRVSAEAFGTRRVSRVAFRTRERADQLARRPPSTNRASIASRCASTGASTAPTRSRIEKGRRRRPLRSADTAARVSERARGERETRRVSEAGNVPWRLRGDCLAIATDGARLARGSRVRRRRRGPRDESRVRPTALGDPRWVVHCLKYVTKYVG